MLNFFRQLAGYPPVESKERVERRYRIPDEYLIEVLELAEASINNNLVARYALWTRLNAIYPPTRYGKWKLDTSMATAAYLIKEAK